MKLRKTAISICIISIFLISLTACAKKDGNIPIPDEMTNPAPDEQTALCFNCKSGFYAGGFSLEILCADADAVIYYTTDGSTPTENSMVYASPIPLTDKTPRANVLSAKKDISAGSDYIPSDKVPKANVIRAFALYPDGTKSDIISGTYFIGIDRAAKYGNVPVISLFTDMSNLFDYETGIYVLGKTYDYWLAADRNNAHLETWRHIGNYSNKGREWERPVTVEFFDENGSSAFVQDMGIRIMGTVSRGSPQKSFRLTARSDYGKKSVKYALIPDNMRSDGNGIVDKYKSFVLRNGGNDCDTTKLRDPFLQQLVADRRFDTLQYTPCIVYLDGEYWGMYSLVEDYSDNYIENNYGIDNNNVVFVKRGKIEDGNDDDIELYNTMFDYITQNDMSLPENYEKAATMLDVGGFADYCAFSLYINNEDGIFDDNNWGMWRVREADNATDYSDGIWRMMVYDVDYSAGVYNGGSNYSEDNISKILSAKENGIGSDGGKNTDKNERPPISIFLSLYKNNNFRREFVLALCDMRNINFEKISAVDKMLAVSDVYSKIVPDTFRRFGPYWAATNAEKYYSQKISELASFINGRYDAFPKIMQSALTLGQMANMDLFVSGGTVRVNSSNVDITDRFSGIYFTDYEIELTAIPTEGRKFVRWEYDGCTVSDETAENITVQFKVDFFIEAVFED